MRKFFSTATVLLIVLFLIGCDISNNRDNSFPDHVTGENTMDHIWSITDKNDFIIEMMEHLNNKTQYGENLSVLSYAERVFFITQTLETEVNNGGFSQFFYNDGGRFANEVVSAFTAIGADKTASICQKAINAFGCDIPSARDERIDLLEKMEEDGIDETFDECDDVFYEYEDDLTKLNYDFVIKNKEQFK